jgi:hypothetical protein
MLDATTLFSSVKSFNKSQPKKIFVSTIQCGEHQVDIPNVNHLAIRFDHNLGYSISFGTYIEPYEIFNGLFYILIQKDVYELARNNLNKIDDISFKLSIEKQFGLDVDYLFAENYQQIHLKLLDKNQHHHFDLIEIAKLVFKQLGLFE